MTPTPAVRAATTSETATRRRPGRADGRPDGEGPRAAPGDRHPVARRGQDDARRARPRHAGGPPQPRARELPAEPDDPATAKRAERIVAVCFLIAMLAGLGFIVAYLIFPVHTVQRALHSNLALGLTMGADLPGPGRRRRDLGPPDHADGRAHRGAPAAAVHREDRAGLQGDLRGGHRGQPVRQAAAAAAHADRRDTSRWRSRRSSCCATSARCRARPWTTPSGARACGCWSTAATRRSGRPTSARPAA